ncbi:MULTISPECIES: polysaccharide biosynthesis/export family protein [Halomonadaceae]|jgi:protein involved in polysaccharide export with SLBB domain|uniref:polysaccharide biosynthesis/export family protein n=1 Tax=Halomonadaceae TaxID=28256 RepID=UPI00088C2F3A|nr:MULTISPECIES: polysaccharide biosynthesis/export family protein [Halomonas]MCD1588695.1 polysaccharide biosynthesis/export family protein [Halomonas sp. IOP_14]NVE92076.1 polysaccharide biosynthesis/export family protein [Halomonas titanicae]CAD5265087.1 Capsid assembly protein [Halomonas sp. 156]CAD5266105.1 Capsid assembly protein [Halomonas sp. I3]CAD5283608.1 Capsid assembly protein [Halomonas sp. 113]
MKVTTLLDRATLNRSLAVASIALVSVFAVPNTWAQALSLSDSILPEQANQQGSLQQQEVNDTPRANWDSGTYGPVSPKVQDPDALPPFGANLFTGGFRGAMGDGLNPDYRIKPGDQVTVRAWGAFELDRVLPVDAQGNIFIPGSGPLKVEGQSSQQVDASVRQAITSVYPDNVQVYTNLQGVQPVAVYVTGYVENPGRYAGTPNDSLLYFLDQSGGIDQDLGSYRQIRVMRDGRNVATVDLYDFLINGNIPRPQFQDGDTIVVEERGPAIAVGGDVHREYRYEMTGNSLSGAELVNLARLRSGVSHVLLRGDREEGPIAQYFPIDMFAGQTIRSGDEVLFSSDKRSETIVVEVEGSYYGPSRYALPRDARLSELLDAIAVPENMTAVESISIKRESVKEQQAQSLEESLRRLETTYLGAPSSTNEEAQIRVQEAELIQDFISRASELEPSGRLVVAYDGRISDIRLQDGDVVTIPEVSDSMLISGEVLVPQAAVYRPGMSVIDYVEGAGGFTDRADDDHILVVRQNGAVENARNVNLRPGDEILVMPAAPTHNLQLASTITQILYQVAVATRVAVDL